MSKIRSTGLALAATALCAPWLTAPATAAESVAASSPTSARAARFAWHCRSYDGSMLKERCVRWTDTQTYFFVGDTDSAINTTNQKVVLTCAVEESKTFTYGGSVTAEAEAGVIFAKAKTSINANFQRSTTTGKSSSVQITVPAHTKRLCQRGTVVYDIRGVLRSKIKEPGYPTKYYFKSFKAHIPTHAGWRIGSPRKLAG